MKSSSRFTEEARSEAGVEVRLIDMGKLMNLLSEYGVRSDLPDVPREKRSDIPLILKRLKLYSPPEFSVYSSTTEDGGGI